MKNGMKRTISLALSAVLLLGSVPFEALATEEPVEEVLEIQPVQTTTVELAPVTKNVANGQEENETPLWVNGSAFTVDSDTVKYVESTNTLALTGADLTAVSSTKEQLLTIQLADNTTNIISGALSALQGIKITGKGTLIVRQINAGENLEVVDAVVKAGVEKKEGEDQQTVITVKDTITFSGEAHLATAAGQKSVAFTDNEEGTQHKIKGEGYYRTAQTGENGVFTKSTSEAEVAAGDYFEFVAEKHLTYSVTDTEHALNCKNECKLEKATVLTEKHSKGQEGDQEADCANPAYCGVCKANYGEPTGEHEGEVEWKPTEDASKHIQTYSGCGCTVGDAKEHDSEVVDCPEGSSVLKRMCSVCGHEDESLRVTIAEPDDLTWNGNEKKAKFTLPDTTVKYYTYNNEIRSETPMDENVFPTAPGKYAAVAEVEISGTTYKPEVVFTIAQKALTDNMVKLSSESVPYDSTIKGLPTVEVTDNGLLEPNTDYEVTFTRDGVTVVEGSEALTNAGTIVVTITGKGNYSSTVTKNFTIEQLATTADMFTMNETEAIPYDGQEHQVTFKKDDTKLGLGDVTAVTYWVNDTKLTDANGTPATKVKDAGTYKIKIDVAGGQNYADVQDLSDDDWTFTINKASSDAITAHGTDPQTVVAGDANLTFIEPYFTGVNEEKITTGTLTYTLNDSTEELNHADLVAKLKTLTAGTATVHYQFEDKNYTEPLTDDIQVNVVEISFTVGENNDPATADNAVTIVEEEKRVYGQENIVTPKSIKASVGDKADSNPSYKVKYQKGNGPVQNSPDAGTNTFYVSYSGTIDGITYHDVLVCQGLVTVKKKVPTPVVTANENLTADGETPVELLTVTEDGGTMQYRLNNNGWIDQIPKVTKAGVYQVYYQVRGDENHEYVNETGPIEVVVVPYLTATYGETLADVEARIPRDNGTWKFNTNNGRVDETKVGNVNEEGNTFRIDFYPQGANKATATDRPVKIYVAPAHIRLDVTVNDKYLPYADGKKVEAKVTVKIAGTDTDFDKNEYTTLCTNITNATDQEVINPGKAQIEVRSNGNYIIDNTADMTKEYVVYNYAVLKLTDTWTYATYGNDDMVSAGYATGKDVKARLDEELDETEYPVTKRKYSDFVMKDNSEKKYVYDPMYWPNDGLALTVAYPTTDADKNDEYKIYAMYTVDSGAERTDLNTEAGTVFELEEADGTLGINEYKKTDSGITVKLKNYATVCFALKENLDKEYNITAKTNSSSKGTVTFKVGSSTSAKSSGTAKKGETITVTPSAKTGYSLTRLNYTYNDGTKDVTTAIDKNSSGKYTFTMPAATVTINAQFDKNASNPSSGDTSNIYVWATVMAVSGLCAVALIAYYFKKRKK